MKFYTEWHRHYSGVNLHTKVMYLCVMNEAGEIVLHRDMKTDPKAFLGGNHNR